MLLLVFESVVWFNLHWYSLPLLYAHICVRNLTSFWHLLFVISSLNTYFDCSDWGSYLKQIQDRSS